MYSNFAETANSKHTSKKENVNKQAGAVAIFNSRKSHLGAGEKENDLQQQNSCGPVSIITSESNLTKALLLISVNRWCVYDVGAVCFFCRDRESKVIERGFLCVSLPDYLLSHSRQARAIVLSRKHS